MSNEPPNTFKFSFIDETVVVLSVDLFGTLVSAASRRSPGEAVAYALRARGHEVPPSFLSAYRSHQFDVHPALEVPLQHHVRAALQSVGTEASIQSVHAALLEAFDLPVSPTALADPILEIIREAPTQSAILSNCSLTGLVPQTLARAGLDPNEFDVVVSSVDIGVRKPDPRCFRAVAGLVGADVTDVIHVGDSPRTDGGVVTAGGRFMQIDAADPTSIGKLRDEVM
ncbi:MAG: HAD family hydrolase [Haloquadratum sp.]|nr:HAD family hydrolase [Haloquadratum sp.]